MLIKSTLLVSTVQIVTWTQFSFSVYILTSSSQLNKTLTIQMHVHVRTVKLNVDQIKYQIIGRIMHVQPLSKTLDNSEHGHTQPAYLHISKSRGLSRSSLG